MVDKSWTPIVYMDNELHATNFMYPVDVTCTQESHTNLYVAFDMPIDPP